MAEKEPAPDRGGDEPPAGSEESPPEPGGGRLGPFLQRLLVRNVLVDVSEIRWIGAEGSYVRIHLGTASYPIRIALGRLARRLDPDRFARIHRSTIVNLDHVRQVVRWFGSDYLVRLQDGAELRLSRSYWRGLKARLMVVE